MKFSNLNAGDSVTVASGSGGTMVLSDGNILTTSKANIGFGCDESFVFTVKGSAELHSSGKMSLMSDSMIAGDAPTVYLNSGQTDGKPSVKIEKNPPIIANPAKRDVCKI